MLKIAHYIFIPLSATVHHRTNRTYLPLPSRHLHDSALVLICFSQPLFIVALSCCCSAHFSVVLQLPH